jgi:Domain of unknown function (DUF2027)/Smr domain
MAVRIGDKVRFLNAVGGGVVSRIEKNAGMVYVEDEDGFEIPVLERECVVVGGVLPNPNTATKCFFTTPSVSSESINDKRDVDGSELSHETEYGDKFNAILAFLPVDIKRLQTTSYDCFFINDSNYYVMYNIAKGGAAAQNLIACGVIEPNTQELVSELTKEDLNDWSQLSIKSIAFKKGKSYVRQPVIDALIDLNPVKFYKLHSFAVNDYFDELAMIIDVPFEKAIDIIREDDALKIKESMLSKKDQVENSQKQINRNFSEDGKLVVDLHINMLLDSTSGMNNSDILKYQIDKFHQVLAENRSQKGKKIIFIHGKGEGVLRSELETQLRSRYKSYYFQDASFREYGFGATMVTIK